MQSETAKKPNSQSHSKTVLVYELMNLNMTRSFSAATNLMHAGVNLLLRNQSTSLKLNIREISNLNQVAIKRIYLNRNKTANHLRTMAAGKIIFYERILLKIYHN